MTTLRFRRPTKGQTLAACLGLVVLVGVVDYLTGYEASFSVFYLLGVALAAWFAGRNYGLAASGLSVALWTVGDLVAGAKFSTPIVPVWNALILLTFYLVAVLLITRIRTLNRDLEDRVRERTRALTQEMAERERLEKEIIEVSEREQRRIGRDLHDNVCQHLTATALAGGVLREKLAAQTSPAAPDAERLVGLIEHGILLARSLARGIMPVDLESESLMIALEELAANISAPSQVQCVFVRDAKVSVRDAATATHLYRITQEAISNALRHGKATRIDITLDVHGGMTMLTIEDNGLGLPEGRPPAHGLGTRIMAHRAAMIGGQFTLEPNATGGTSVRLTFPATTTP